MFDKLKRLLGMHVHEWEYSYTTETWSTYHRGHRLEGSNYIRKVEVRICKVCGKKVQKYLN